MDKVNELNAYIIVFTGDFFSNYSKYKAYDEGVNQLKRLKANIGKFCVYGNNDYGGGAVRV